MGFDILESLVKNALAEARDYCTFGFQGGEPTLAGLDYFKKLVAMVGKYNINNIRIHYTLQTNGLVIDEHWAKFFSEHRFLIGLSIDATKQVHDTFRLDYAGKGTHTRCIKAARLLTEHNVDYNILTVVTHNLASHPDQVYRFYKQCNYRYIQFIACLDALHGGGQSDRKYLLDAVKYGKFLCRIFDLWYADFIKGEYYSIRAFDNYIRMLAGQPPENCAMNGICTAYALIEADGSVYPCDFYAVDECLLGKVTTHTFGDMLCGEKAEAFIKPSRYMDAACDKCDYYFICRGGCRRDREPVLNTIPSLNRLCESYKLFFSHSLPRMIAISKHIK